MNLLYETLDILKEHGKTPAMVEFVSVVAEGSWWDRQIEGWISWGQFEAIANFSYDPGYGGVEIDPLVRVVGVDWWLERHEYDGAEWWEFKTLPRKPEIRVSEATEKNLRRS